MLPSRRRRGNTPIWICTTIPDVFNAESRRRGLATLLAATLAGLLLLPLGASAWWWQDEEGIDRDFTRPMSTWYRSVLDDLVVRWPDKTGDPLLVVRVAQQRLYLFQAGVPMKDYPVSTSRHGIGNRDDSLQTPLGVHQVRRKIGTDAPFGTIFRGRRDTGRIAEILTSPDTSPEDNITSRILWLDGMEEGVNWGEGIDSFQRFIYIHGTDEEGLIGRPASDGCVRMHNRDVIELFDRLPLGTLVVIVE
jgi:hypothetical protein